MDRHVGWVGGGSCWGLGWRGGCNEEVSDVNDDVMWLRPLESLIINQNKTINNFTCINVYTTLPRQQHSTHLRPRLKK